jgi:cytochrome P450
MTDSAARCIDRWDDGESIDASEDMTRVAMSVASKTLFGVDTFDEADEIGDALTTALRWSADAATSISLGAQVTLADGLDSLARRLPAGLRAPLESAATSLEHPVKWPGKKSRRLEDAIALLDDRVAEMIAARRASPEGYDDLLARLLAARDEDGSAMDDRQLRDEVLTLFVAGHETTATALSWALYLLARAPEIRAAIEEEADALEGRTPTADDLARLPMTRRVFAEALRLYPPVPVYERQALEDVEVAGLHLPVGSIAAVFPWALHHNPSVWPDPDRFDPDRFTESAERDRHRYAWVPFGAGPRVCIGNHFALQEGPLVLCCIAARARLDLESEDEILPDPAAATLRPRGGVPMRVRLRS